VLNKFPHQNPTCSSGVLDPALRLQGNPTASGGVFWCGNKFIIVFLVACQVQAAAGIINRTPAEIVEKVTGNFLKIKDASAEIALEYDTYIFSCAGKKRLIGKGQYKAPDKLQGTIETDTYFTRGNKISKLDKNNKRYCVTLLNAPDFSLGYHPGLMANNFFLKLLKDNPEEIVIEGTPKPRVLKNVKKIIFYIDPKEYLLRKLDVIFPNPLLSGTIYIDYEKIKGLWVPVGCHGKSAVEVRSSILIGVGFKLASTNMKINTGLPDKLFDPGF